MYYEAVLQVIVEEIWGYHFIYSA